MGLLDRFFGKTEATPKAPEVKTQEPIETRLEAQPFYHGIRGRDDILDDLTEMGDFLVRVNQGEEKITIALTVMAPRGFSNYNITFIHEHRKYGLGILVKDARTQNPLTNFANVPKFDNIVDLVNYYKVHPLPCGNKLKRGVPKPAWLIKHTQIEYDPVADKIASGNFGSVYRGYFTKSNGEKIRAAMKVCHQESEGKDNALPKAANEAREAMMHEARLMSDYKFDNVIEFFGVACGHPPVILVMEYCPGDSLENHLLADRGDTVIERILYCYEAARGMRYLHVQHCIHSDLASRNCLISAEGFVKIADFGLSRFAEDLNPTAKSKIPIRWMAPETFGRKAKVVQKSDVWAFGVLVYEVFKKGEMPWPNDKNFKAMAKRIRAGDMPPLPDFTPSQIKSLVSKCWMVDIDRRATFNECYQLLSDYLSSNLGDFPPIEKFAINKIPGVQRLWTFKEDTAEQRIIKSTAKRLTKEKEETTDGNNQKQGSNSRSKNRHHRRRKGVSKLTTGE